MSSPLGKVTCRNPHGTQRKGPEAKWEKWPGEVVEDGDW